LVILIRESEVKMTDMGVTELVDAVIAREGGFVDHPADRGGATHWGITEAVARQNGYTGPMRKLPRDLAVSIYTQQYWHSPGFDKIAKLAPSLAAELFDTGINMGTLTAIAYLQRALNALNRNGADYADIIVDRQIGPATLNALSRFLATRGRHAESVLTKAIDALQGAHYLRLAESRPSQEAFLYGWLANRIG
jgi:lysozyme family protein